MGRCVYSAQSTPNSLYFSENWYWRKITWWIFFCASENWITMMWMESLTLLRMEILDLSPNFSVGQWVVVQYEGDIGCIRWNTSQCDAKEGRVLEVAKWCRHLFQICRCNKTNWQVPVVVGYCFKQFKFKKSVYAWFTQLTFAAETFPTN